MGFIFWFHSVFGERVLPLLIIIAAIWFTVTWKPDAARTLPVRIFPLLVDIQFTLGLIYWIYGIIIENRWYLTFPFILHPILGLLAVVIAHAAAKPKGPMRRLGRWAPLVSMGVLLLVVLGAVIVSTSMA